MRQATKVVGGGLSAAYDRAMKGDRVEAVVDTGGPVRTGRFMTSRLIALVEHPAADERGRVEVTTRHRIQPARTASS